MKSTNDQHRKNESEFIIHKILAEIDTLPHDEVLPEIEELYSRNPKDVPILKALTHIHYHKKDYTKALHFVLKALDESPDDVQALKYKAWIYSETGDEDNYIKILKQISEAGEADFEVNDQLAVHFENNGHILMALGLYTKALQDPANYQPLHAAIGGANCYSKSGAFEIADEIYDTLSSIYPRDSMLIFNKATNYCANREVDVAVKMLHKLIANDLNNKALNNLLSELNKKKTPNTGLKNLRDDEVLKSPKNNDSDGTLQLDYNADSVKELSAEYFDLMKNYKYFEAKDKLKEILQIDDTIAIVWSNLASIHFTFLEIHESLECCEKALSLVTDPDDKIIGFISVKKAYALFALGKLEEALGIAEKELIKDPNNYSMLVLKARILNRNKNYEDAIRILLSTLKSMTQQGETEAFAKYLLAAAYQGLGDEAEAKKALTESAAQGCEFGIRWLSVLNKK